MENMDKLKMDKLNLEARESCDGAVYVLDGAKTVAILPSGNPDRLLHAQLLMAGPAMATLLEHWVTMIETDHAAEIASDHHGDGPNGCTYCQSLAISKLMLAKVRVGL